MPRPAPFTFANLSFSSGNVQVSGYASNARCMVSSWSGNTTNVICRSPSGATVDSRYTLSVLLKGVFSTANAVAYAWAHDMSSANYTLSGGSSYNASGGAVTATRSAVGTYAIDFSGLTLDRGNVHVNTYSGNRYCNVADRGGSTISVNCYDSAGAAADTRYSISVVLNNMFSAAHTVAYAWVDDEYSYDYELSASYSYNSTGQAIRAGRTTTGVYEVSFLGQSLNNSHVMVSAYGGTAGTRHCNTGGSRSDIVFVRCFNAAGNLADSRYTLSVTLSTPPGIPATAAYAWANDPTSASYTPNDTYSYNSGGGAMTATRSSTGVYAMSFDGLTLDSGDVQVSGYGSAARCNVVSRGGSVVNVACRDATGNPVDSQYTVSVVLNNTFSVANTVAYARTHDPSSASYTPSADYAYNAGGGAITATRSSPGVYAISFGGLSLNGGTVQVSAYGSDKHCNVGEWSGSEVKVNCYDSVGAAADTPYTLSVVLNNVFSTVNTVAYAWANDSTSPTYSPSGAYAYNSSGQGITASRSAPGTYQIQFDGLNLGNGHVKVSPYGSNTSARCNINSWGGTSVEVRCYTPEGVLTDSAYTLAITR